jgi:hypothetical protein
MAFLKLSAMAEVVRLVTVNNMEDSGREYKEKRVAGLVGRVLSVCQIAVAVGKRIIGPLETGIEEP